MWKRWCCWRGKARKSKDYGDLCWICRCAFVVYICAICSSYRGGVRRMKKVTNRRREAVMKG